VPSQAGYAHSASVSASRAAAADWRGDLSRDLSGDRRAVQRRSERHPSHVLSLCRASSPRVLRAIATSSELTQLGVVSPVSRKQYEMQCVSADRYVILHRRRGCGDLSVQRFVVAKSREFVAQCISGRRGWRVRPDSNRAIHTSRHDATCPGSECHTDDADLVPTKRCAHLFRGR
jgi:hypothetical protein